MEKHGNQTKPGRGKTTSRIPIPRTRFFHPYITVRHGAINGVSSGSTTQEDSYCTESHLVQQKKLYFLRQGMNSLLVGMPDKPFYDGHFYINSYWNYTLEEKSH